MSYTKEQVESRTSDYVCVDCGIQFLTEEQKQNSGVSTFHTSQCGLCGETTGVTSIRHYNWLRLPSSQ